MVLEEVMPEDYGEECSTFAHQFEHRERSVHGLYRVCVFTETPRDTDRSDADPWPGHAV